MDITDKFLKIILEEHQKVSDKISLNDFFIRLLSELKKKEYLKRLQLGYYK